MPFVHVVGAWFAGLGLALATLLFTVWLESRRVKESDMDDPREWYGN